MIDIQRIKKELESAQVQVQVLNQRIKEKGDELKDKFNVSSMKELNDKVTEQEAKEQEALRKLDEAIKELSERYDQIQVAQC